MMKANAIACQVCGRPLAGRSDKKYCSDQCRAQLHNQKKKLDAGELIIQDINRVLRKNRSILRSNSPMGNIITRQDSLVLQGFDFSYFTHQHCSPKNDRYTFCYDYGYLLLPEDMVMIVKEPEHLDS
jgi:predicted nucleic acid-binding Zn ribbon protein